MKKIIDRKKREKGAITLNLNTFKRVKIPYSLKNKGLGIL